MSDSNVFAPPSEPETLPVHGVRIYSLNAIVVACVLFTPLVGYWMAAANYRAMGQTGAARRLALAGAAVGAPFAFVVVTNGMSLGTGFWGLVAAAFIYTGQNQAIRRLHQPVVVSWAAPFAFGLVWVLCLNEAFNVLWALTGDPAFRPDWWTSPRS